MYDLGIGLLVFNPYDDQEHKERITNCLASIIKAIETTDRKIKLLVLLNQAVTGNDKQVGVGKKTKKMVEEMLHTSHTDYRLLAKRFPDSMNVAGYHRLQTELHQVEKCDKVAVFADDYIVPTRWIETIFNEFKRYRWAEFLTPSTVFVNLLPLLVPLDLQPHWQLAKQQGKIVGIRSGISMAEVNKLATSLQHEKAVINYFAKYEGESGHSFESTVFTNRFLTTYGYIYPKYFSTRYSHEYFCRAKKNGARGIISRRAFIFHYGKGGTASVYPQTRDERFKGSPAVEYLKRDVDLYNKRNNANASYFWQKKPSLIVHSSNVIKKQMKMNNRYYIPRLIEIHIRYILVKYLLFLHKDRYINT